MLDGEGMGLFSYLDGFSPLSFLSNSMKTAAAAGAAAYMFP